jgi:Holliday junction DNA helicase RuvA
MIDSISGRVTRLGGDQLVIETGGIAYRIFCPTRVVAGYRAGEEIVSYTHLLIRDDAMHLFGFSSFEEREIFRSLLTVGQVGPKLALQLLSTLAPEELVEAVSAGDVERLVTVKGIGRKTAQRIVIELRDKLGGKALPGRVHRPLCEKEETALRALTSKSLGFSAREAREALERLRGEDLPLEELVRRALEIIGS